MWNYKLIVRIKFGISKMLFFPFEIYMKRIYQKSIVMLFFATYFILHFRKLIFFI